MTISVITSKDAIHRVARSLGFQGPAPVEDLEPEVIAQALRRAVHILAPCGKHELENAMLESFAGLGHAREELAPVVEHTLEELIVYGDILEMRDADDDHWSRSALVLRPAPPSFIERKNGSIVVVGVAGDEITPFTPELASRIRHNSGLRTIYPHDGEDLKSLLHEIGLLELPERVWLRIPKLESAESYLADQRRLLAKEPPSGGIEGIRILDPSRSPAFYRDRWLDAGARHEGIFVARRPQRYGSALWCLLELQGGVVRRFMDLHSQGDRIRPCDIAWHIQMAIDAEVGTPQSVRIRKGQQTSVLSFFSPLPSWAERRLAVVAAKTLGGGSLFSYELPTNDLEEEVAFFKKGAVVSREQGLRQRIGKNMTSTIQQTIDELRDALTKYIEATYHIGHPGMVRQRRRLLEEPGGIFQFPYLESTPRYVWGERYGKHVRDTESSTGGVNAARRQDSWKTASI